MIEFALRHEFGHGAGLVALDIAFAAPTPGISVLFGPSGAGKSSAIAAFAGLLRPDQCRVVVDGTVLCDTAARLWTPPERRRIGVVFQDARLFPHLSVRGNLLYGLRRAAPGPIAVAQVVALLGLDALLDRRPHTLSGGERQRVGIGRAVLSQPRLLLMDEPLASLDDERRDSILPFVARLARDFAIPIVYVTHRVSEAAALADTVVLLRNGRVVAADTPFRLSSRADLYLSTLDEAGAILSAHVLEMDAARGLTAVQAGAARLLIPPVAACTGDVLRLRVPASDVILARAAPGIAVSAQNLLPGTVRTVQFWAGQHAAMVELDLGGGAVLLARITPDAAARLALEPGATALALVKASAIQRLGA